MFRSSDALKFDACPAPIAEAIKFLRPKPSPWSFVRFGGARDGAYLLPDCLAGVSACFSPGVRNSKSFEDELVQKKHIRSHLMDFTSSPDKFLTPLNHDYQTFEKKWLAPAPDKDSRSLAEWVDMYEPHDRDLILQIDIEGAEWPILAAVQPETLRRFRIIVIELHKMDELLSDFEQFSARALDAFSTLQENFTVLHAHPNNCCGASSNLFGTGFRVPRTLELTLVRTDYLDAQLASSSASAPRLPHPLDIGRNVPGAPPIFLGTGWRSERMPLKSIVRIACEFAEFEVLWRWKRLVPPALFRWITRQVPGIRSLYRRR